MSDVIYEHDDFKFTTDDIFIRKSNKGFPLFFINISKYFDVKYSTKNNFNKIKMIPVLAVSDYSLVSLTELIKTNYNISSFYKLGTKTINGIHFFPADYIVNSNAWKNIKENNYTLATHNYPVKYKHTDNYKFVKKKYKRISKQVTKRLLMQEQLKRPNYVISRKYNLMHNTNHIKAYKKLKRFDTIYSRPVINEIFKLIAISIINQFEIDGLKMYAMKINYLFSKLTDKKKYKLTKRIFILAMQHRYGDIRSFLSKKPCNMYISERTIKKYEKTFNLICYALNSYMYKDAQDSDNAYNEIKSIGSNQPDMNNKYIRDIVNNYRCNLDSRRCALSIQGDILNEISFVFTNKLFSNYFALNKKMDDKVSYYFLKPINFWEQTLAKQNNEEYEQKDELACFISVRKKRTR